MILIIVRIQLWNKGSHVIYCHVVGKSSHYLFTCSPLTTNVFCNKTSTYPLNLIKWSHLKDKKDKKLKSSILVSNLTNDTQKLYKVRSIGYHCSSWLTSARSLQTKDVILKETSTYILNVFFSPFKFSFVFFARAPRRSDLEPSSEISHSFPLIVFFLAHCTVFSQAPHEQRTRPSLCSFP